MLPLHTFPTRRSYGQYHTNPRSTLSKGVDLQFKAPHAFLAKSWVMAATTSTGFSVLLADSVSSVGIVT